MKKIITCIALVALLSSTTLPVSAAEIAVNPTTDVYYANKSYATYEEWVADAYINIESITATSGLDFVIEANVHYDNALIEDSETGSGDGLPSDNWQEAFQNQAYGRIYAVVQFIRYDTLTDSTTYKQVIHDIAPDKIVLNDLYDTGDGYTGRTDLLYSAGLYYRDECGLNDTNMIIGTARDSGVSVVENGVEVIYKTKIIGVYGYLETPTIKSKHTYKEPAGDLHLCDTVLDIQTLIGEYGRASITDFEQNVQSATGQVIDAVGDGISGLVNMITGLLSSVGQVPAMIQALFVFLPVEVTIMLGSVIALSITVAIIKIVT